MLQQIIYNSSSIEPIYGELTDGVATFSTADTVINTLYWVQVCKSSDYPIVTTTKDYFVLYSTNHDSGDGGIYWAEADDLDLNGFIERGLIIDGYQSETPYLIIFPNDPDSETLHLYYHPNITHPQSGGYQQTRLLTSVGGELHTTTWTDRGQVLGINAQTEDHTGYLVPYLQTDNSLIGIHVTRQWLGNTIETIPRIGKSTSLNSRSWTRQTSFLDITSFMSDGRQMHHSPSFFFNVTGQQYALAVNISYDFDFPTSKIALFKCDGNFNTTQHIKDISGVNSGDGQTNTTYYRRDNIIHVYYIISNTVYHSMLDISKF